MLPPPIPEPPDPPARCPLCEAPGRLGRLCPRTPCARRGYHAVPFGPEAARRGVDPLVGQRLGRHLVVGPLGRGGMAAVYLGLDEDIGQQVAIKALGVGAVGEDPAAHRRRFRKEAEALARLSHPNIVRLVAFGTHHDMPYLAMERVPDQRTLADEMKRGLAPDDARRVLLQLAYALEAAHAQGIVHRDIKPANVMLQSTPAESHFVRLVDFGLAKFTDDGQQTRLVAGTPAYMAPEQVARKRIGPWTDIYAMGVLTFELLTGTRLFGDRPGLEIMRWKRDPAHSPVDLVPPAALSAAMRRFLDRALAYEPMDRIATAAAYRDALAALLAEDARVAGSQPASAIFVAPTARPRPRRIGRLALAASLAVLGAAAWLWRAAPAGEGAASAADGTTVIRPGEPGGRRNETAPAPPPPAPSVRGHEAAGSVASGAEAPPRPSRRVASTAREPEPAPEPLLEPAPEPPPEPAPEPPPEPPPGPDRSLDGARLGPLWD